MRKILYIVIVVVLFCSVCFLPEANAIEHTYNWTAGTDGNFAYVKEGFEQTVKESNWVLTKDKTIPVVHSLSFKDCGKIGNTLGYSCTATIFVKSNCDSSEKFTATFSSTQGFDPAEYRILGRGLARKFLDRFHNQKSQCR